MPSLLPHLARTRGWARVLRERVFGLLWVYDTEPLELLLGLIALQRGLTLLAPWDTFSISPTFRLLDYWMTENQWGAAFTVVGVVKLIGLVFDWKPRKWAHLVALWLWTTTATGFLLVEYRQTASGLYLLLAAGCFWLLVRSGKY